MFINQAPVLTFFTPSLPQDKCTLTKSGDISTGVHVFEVTLEDYPTKDINVTYPDGSRVLLNASDAKLKPLCSLKLLFSLEGKPHVWLLYVHVSRRVWRRGQDFSYDFFFILPKWGSITIQDNIKYKKGLQRDASMTNNTMSCIIDDKNAISTVIRRDILKSGQKQVEVFFFL